MDRLSKRVLCAVVLLVAGCATQAPGAGSPSVSVAATAEPTSVATATPSLVPTATATATFATPAPTPFPCPTATADDRFSAGSVVIEAPRGRTEVYIAPTSYRPHGGAWTTLTDQEHGTPDVVTLVGGRDLRLALRPDSPEDDADPGPFEDMDVGLETSAGTIALPVTLDGDGATVRIPDEAISGLLRIEVTWSDACFTVRGLAPLTAEITPSAIADACGEPDDVLAMVFASQDVRVSLDAAEVGLGTISWQAKYNGGGGSDQVPAFAAWDPAGVEAVAPAGGHRRLRIHDPAFRPTGATLAVWRRADMAFDGLPYPTDDPILSAVLDLDEDGVLAVPFPARKGRYVMDIGLGWDHKCMTGGSLLYVSAVAQ